MDTRKRLTGIVFLAGILFLSPTIYGAGSLEPSAAPGPIMKTLDEVEPRILIKAADLPLTISEPNSYYLAETINFSVTDTDAITIECNDVTIDLMGYHLIGPGKAVGASGSGIFMSAQGNVEIRNGTIRDFRYCGIWAASTNDENHRIIGVRTLSNGASGIFLFGDGHMVKDCTASKNTLYGIFTNSGAKIMGNTADNNLDAGITVGEGCTITGNTVSWNGNNGIYSSAGCVITGNTVSWNGDNGIFSSAGCTITGNTAYANIGYGIYATGYALVDQNTSYANFVNLYAGVGSQVGLNVAP